MNLNEPAINKKPLMVNYVATVIVVILLFYNFYTFKTMRYFILGIVGIFLMIISTIFECYFCRIVFSFPRAIKIRNFIITLALMYLGVLILVLTVTLNHSWKFSLILTVVCQFLYSFISYYAIYLIIKKRPFNIPEESGVENTSNNHQISNAYSPEIQYDGSVYLPPDPYYNDFNEEQSNSNLTDRYSESGRKLTNGLHYVSPSPNIYSIGKLDSNELYGIKYPKSSDSNQVIDLNSTTGAVSEYEILHAQSEASDAENTFCNPYANMHSENVI